MILQLEVSPHPHHLLAPTDTTRSEAANVSAKESDILLKIIQLNIRKIRQYLKVFHTVKGVFDQSISAAEDYITGCLSHFAPSRIQQFLEWFRNISAIRSLPQDVEPAVLIDHILWAQKARRYFLDSLSAAFSTKDGALPRWVLTILKLGRYGVASRALVQLAIEFPAMFNTMMVEPLAAPAKIPVVVPETEEPLICVLRRVVGSRAEELKPRLARVWNTTDAEALFRQTCCRNLVVHAEMQLINFYDHNQQCKPTFRFIGVSKKSCYLCHMFLTTHPESFCVSSCHQKLYLPWIPPPATDSKVYKRYKALTNELSKVMEATAKQDLEDRLDLRRRLVPADSTAGVSLSGLTNSAQDTTQSHNPGASQDGSAFNEEQQTEISPVLHHPIEVVSLTAPRYGVESNSLSESWAHSPSEDSPRDDWLKSISALVLHVMRVGNASQQDIISIGDILDPSTSLPSWERLLQFLEVDEGFGIAFNRTSEFLMFNRRIRVVNERQLLACLQYLHNSGTLNSEVLVCGAQQIGDLLQCDLII